MARSTKNATLICVIVTILALVGIVLGIKFDSMLITMFLLLPAIIYEVYRVEGKFTRYAAW